MAVAKQVLVQWCSYRVWEEPEHDDEPIPTALPCEGEPVIRTTTEHWVSTEELYELRTTLACVEHARYLSWGGWRVVKLELLDADAYFKAWSTWAYAPPEGWAKIHSVDGLCAALFYDRLLVDPLSCPNVSLALLREHWRADGSCLCPDSEK